MQDTETILAMKAVGEGEGRKLRKGSCDQVPADFVTILQLQRAQHS